jgi:hypothetical protein
MELVRKDPKRGVDIGSSDRGNREDLVRRVAAKELDGYLWLVAKPDDQFRRRRIPHARRRIFTAGGLQGAIKPLCALRLRKRTRRRRGGIVAEILRCKDHAGEEGKVFPTDPAKGFGA